MSGDLARVDRGDAVEVKAQYVIPLGVSGTTSPNKVEDTASASGDVGVGVMAVQKASAADLATDNDYAFLQMKDGRLYTRNMREPLGVAAEAVTPVVTSALATSKVIKAGPGNLHSINCAATTAAGMFLIHNATSAPAAGAVTPIKAYPVAIGQGLDISYDPPLRFSTGISVTFSTATTPYTQTDSATAFISGDAV